MNLEGKVALITGAGRGIGRSIALTLARAGADLAITSRTASQLEGVATEIKSLGKEVVASSTDISKEDEVGGFVKKTLDRFEKIDILVNNAGTFRGAHVVDMPTEDWDRIINTNLRGTFFMTRAVLPSMIERSDGTIVMVSSTSSKRADPGGSAYAASKFGMMGFAMSLLYEVREHNVRVVVVSPSAVDTRPLPTEEIPAGGSGARLRAEDIAETVLHMVSLPNRALVREVEVWATNP